MINQTNSFSIKTEAVQYNAVLAISKTIKGTSRAKLYKELGIESRSFFFDSLEVFVLFIKLKYNVHLNISINWYLLKITHMILTLLI